MQEVGQGHVRVSSDRHYGRTVTHNQALGGRVLWTLLW